MKLTIQTKKWLYRENTFSLEIVKSVDSEREIGSLPKIWWFVYLYIYQGHPLFARFKDRPKNLKTLDQLNDILPFHSGITYYEKIYSDNRKICSLKVGCDYQHKWDLAGMRDDDAMFRKATQTAQKIHKVMIGM